MKPGIQTGVLCLALAVAGVALFVSRRANAELAARVTRLTRQNADLRYDLKQASRQATDVGGVRSSSTRNWAPPRRTQPPP